MICCLRQIRIPREKCLAIISLLFYWRVCGGVERREVFTRKNKSFFVFVYDRRASWWVRARWKINEENWGGKRSIKWRFNENVFWKIGSSFGLLFAYSLVRLFLFVLRAQLGVLGQGRFDCDWHKLPIEQTKMLKKKCNKIITLKFACSRENFQRDWCENWNHFARRVASRGFKSKLC